MIEECLAPGNGKLKQEAKLLGLPVYTHKQKIYAPNANSFSQDPFQVKSSNELKSFLRQSSVANNFPEESSMEADTTFNYGTWAETTETLSYHYRYKENPNQEGAFCDQTESSCSHHLKKQIEVI